MSMKLSRKTLIAASALILAIMACNIGVPAPGQKVDLNEAMTLVAQTIQAATQQAAAGIPTNTVPPPVVAPTVTVSSDTNCRTGPNINYSLVMLYQTGMTAEVIAKYTASNYWIIKYPGGGGNSCWLWGQYATVVGDTAGLPEAVPPPLPPTATPAPSAPKPPKNLDYSCTSENTSQKIGNFWLLSNKLTVHITWTDNSDNENGFHIYKEGSLLATRDANKTSYNDVFTVGIIIGNFSYTYGVSSFNDFGESVIKEITMTECPH